ncbi:MAG: NAD(+) synthase [Alphaproteobacteria bacterium]|nr:NAD(+) synthase [Alphaproteobacteria bacterium]
MEKLWNKLKTGLRKYCAENGFDKVIIGLSGGLDSATCAVLAADVLGGENVTAIMMKTRYTSDLSLNIAREISALNGLKYHELNIEPLVEAEIGFLQQAFGAEVRGITKENLQARIRGQLLMAWSNQNGGLVLACGNKSEALTGYCTLYGDTCGGLMPIGNVYKTTIFELAKWRNTQGRVLPESVITRAPSAELAAGQIDENSLPPYAVLDAVLKLLYDEHKTIAEAVAVGFEQTLVERVNTLIKRSAFKRKQTAEALAI